MVVGSRLRHLLLRNLATSIKRWCIMSSIFVVVFLVGIHLSMQQSVCSDLSRDVCGATIAGGCQCRWFSLDELGVTTTTESSTTQANTVTTTTTDNNIDTTVLFCCGKCLICL
jgi:hypothetical protein